MAACLGPATSALAAPQKQPMDYGAPPPEGPAAPFVVGRVALFPLWLIAEYGVRRPFAFLVTTADRFQWPDDVRDVSALDDEQKFFVSPSLRIDVGVRSMIGFDAYWRDAVVKQNTLGVHFGTWGSPRIDLVVTDTYRFHWDDTFVVQGSIDRRDDSPYYGIGPRAPSTPTLRYASAQAAASLAFDHKLARTFTASARARLTSFGYRGDSCCGDASVAQAIAAGTIPAPPGFGDGFTAIATRGALAIDFRTPTHSKGFHASLWGEPAFALDSRGNAGRRSWVTYGGTAGYALDLTGTRRVLSLTLDAEAADPITGAVPFVEQVTLGGDARMRGFLSGRLVDRSAVVVTAEYAWPIWVYLDGVVHVAAGNVFGPHLEGFDPSIFRLSGDIGVRTPNISGNLFEIFVAAATEPLDEGGHISSARFFLGTHGM